MNDRAGKVLVAESDEILREHVVAVLSDAGYEVTTDCRGGMKAVVTFNPDTVVLGADPPSSIVVTFFLKSKALSRRPTYAL